MADKQLWQVTPVATDVKNDDGVIIGGQTAGTRYAPLTLIANFVHNLWASFVHACTAITSFADDDTISVSNPTDGTRKMSKDTLLTLTAQNAKDSLGLLPVAKQQIFGYLAPDGITSLNDYTDNIVVEINKTSLTPVTEFPSDYEGSGILICTKTNYSSSNYRVYQKLIHYGSRTMYSRLFDSSNSAWTAWTSNAIEGKYLRTLEKALWAGYSGNMASLDDAPVNTSLIITATSYTTTTNFPADFIDYPSGTDGVLFTFETLVPTSNSPVKKQVLLRLSDGRTWSRSKLVSWTAWTDGALSAAGIFAAYGTEAGNLPSLNNAEINKIYLFNPTSSTATTDFPADYGEGIGVLYTQKSMYTSSYYLNVQMLVKLATGEIWYRQYVSATSTWSTWTKASGSLTASDWFGVYTDLAINLVSLDDALTNKTYLIVRNESTTTTNFPIDFGSGNGILSTYQGKYTSSWYLKYQILTKYRPNGGTWYRQYVSATDTWGSWVRVDASTEITIGPGKMYATLREGFAEAFRHYNSKVIVYPGEYDLVQEFADVLPTISDHNGCLVGKGMHVIFMAGAHVSAMVEKGSYTDEQFNKIKLYFHPFAYYPDSSDLNDDFTVEGLDIRAKHTRYAFHDDYGSSQVPCVHKFINCKMYFENTNTTAQNNFVSAIGGGLGRHTTVIIDGGYYECNIAVGSSSIMNGDPDYSQVPISYHNTTSSDEDSESKIILKDVYFADKGYFRASALGGSSVPSKIYISGCRSYFPPLLQKGSSVPSEAPYFNVEVKASWNNEVVQNGHWVLDSDDHGATWIPSNT